MISVALHVIRRLDSTNEAIHGFGRVATGINGLIWPSTYDFFLIFPCTLASSNACLRYVSAAITRRARLKDLVLVCAQDSRPFNCWQ